jgi:hypothetical protein
VRTVIGVVSDELGHAQNEHRSWATPSAQVSSTQDDEILVDQNHDHRWIGRVVHLELRQGKLWAVAEVDDAVEPFARVRVGDEVVPVEQEQFWSATRIGGGSDPILFTSLSLTPWPARVFASPVAFLPGRLDYREVARERWHLRGFAHDLLTRAAVTRLERRGGPLIVQDERSRALEGLPADSVEALAALEEQAFDPFWKSRPLRRGAVVHGSILSVR